METLIKQIDPENIDIDVIEEFGEILKNGGTVIFPTETVYGLGANALDEKAASKIYTAKGRPSDNPLLVHIADIEDIKPLVLDIDEKAKVLMEKFWPGPLTIVFKKSNLIPNITSGGLDTVAIRFPSDKVARALIKSSGLPIAAPSANISGKPSPTKAQHIIDDMSGRVDGILIGGFCDFGVESTIVDVSGDYPLVLRPGAITLEMLRDALGSRVELDPSLLKKDDNIFAKAPGMKYTHYSPNAEVYIVEGEDEKVVEKINQLVDENLSLGKKSAVLCINSNVGKYNGEVIGLGNTYEEVARNLFDSLIELDNRNIDIAFTESFEESGIGVAIMNRLRKSAGYKVIKV